MAGINNNVPFGNGYRLEPSGAREFQLMQQASTNVGTYNVTGSPEGVVPANPSSLCHDPVSGILYRKNSGTGNTGWVVVGSGSGGIVSWVDVTSGASPVALVPSTGYVSHDPASNVTFTLPTTSAFGLVIRVVNAEASFNWTITQAAGQSIQYGIKSTTVGTGGSLTSTSIGDAVELLCIVANTTWIVLSSNGGNITYV
jgi:hypothetical protein